MGHGSLVPDAMILRLITNELTTRGWLKPSPLSPLTVNASAHAFSPSLSSSETELAANDDDTLAPPRQTLATNDDPGASYILDGFPRTSAQAAALDALVPMNMVVHLATPAAIVLDRIVNRWVHAPSGRVYNTTFNPPRVPGRDDVTGEPLTRREDDSEQVWATRLRKFEETSTPLLEHYERRGLLWRVEGRSSDEISPRLFGEFGRRFGVG